MQRTATVPTGATRPAEPEQPLGVPRRDPTGNTAIARADRAARDPWGRPATEQQLRSRLLRAVQTEDGRGIQVITHLLVRSA